MKIFNSIQLMILFVITPYAIAYCKDATFYAHGVMTWLLIGGYIVGFGALTGLLADNLSN